MKTLDFLQTNDRLANALKEGTPFSCFRICNTSGFVMQKLFHKDTNFHGHFSERHIVEFGIHPTDFNTAFQIYSMTMQLAYDADILGFVDLSGEIERDQSFIDSIIKDRKDKETFFGKTFLIMDPACLLGYSEMGPCPDPWTKYLKGKKVLAITSHADSFESQWENIDKIWGDKRDIIAPFELAGVIRSPYHPLMDDRQPPGSNSWSESTQYIMSQMDEYDYDVLLASSSTNSPFFAAYAKSQGKIGIQTGATLQLFFGVLGSRWHKEPCYAAWHQMYNEHWKYPLESDKPTRANKYNGLEAVYAYW